MRTPVETEPLAAPPEKQSLQPIKSMPGLSDDAQRVEKLAVAMATSDPDGLVEQYFKKFGDQAAISADDFKTLLPEYESSPEKYASAVHNASSALAEYTFHKRSAELPKGARILFMAGGPGSGKTSSVKFANGEVAKIRDEANLIYDTMMSKIDKNDRLFAATLERGHAAAMIYVDADVGQAVRQMIERAEGGERRVVPLTQMAEGHYTAQSAQLEPGLGAWDKWQGRVNIKYINNRGPFGSAHEVDIEDIHELAYDGYGDALQKANEAFEQYIRERADEGRPIREEIIRAASNEPGIGGVRERGSKSGDRDAEQPRPEKPEKPTEEVSSPVSAEIAARQTPALNELPQGRSETEPPAIREPRPPKSPTVTGKTTRVKIPGTSRAYEAKYAVREAEDVILRTTRSTSSQTPNITTSTIAATIASCSIRSR